MCIAVLVRLSDPQIERKIRLLAQDSANVILTTHAKQRMKERKVTHASLLECLRKGRLGRKPEPNLVKGSLECRMERYCVGVNLAVIVALSDEEPNAIVVTVFDE